MSSGSLMDWGSRREKFMSRAFYNLAAFDFEIFDFLLNQNSLVYSRRDIF